MRRLAWIVPLVTLGCPSPSTYSTPRTVEAGKLSYSVAPELYVYASRSGKTDGYPSVPPTFAMRVGASDRVDLGFRIGGFFTAGVDAKLNFVRDRIDLAFAPGVNAFFLAHPNTFHVHLPLLVGVNASESVSVVALFGPSFAEASRRDRVTYATIGVGLDLRVTRWFALHPQVTAMRDAREARASIYQVGLGFNWGALPSFEGL